MEENKKIETLPEVRAAVAALSPEDRKLLAAVQESPFYLTTPEQFREFADNVDFFTLEPGVRRLDDLGWSYLEQHMDIPLSPALREAIDPIPFGRQAMEEDHGCFTSRGYLTLSGDEWRHEHVADRSQREPEKKPSIRERLEQGKKECAGRQTQPHTKGKSGPEL